MTYEVGQDILDNEINGFVGPQAGSAYASQAAVNAAAPCVGAIYGVGFGNRGYGQSAISLSVVTPGQVIGSSEWTALRNALAVIREHQTGSVPGTVPPTSVLEVGDVIQAHESGPPTNDAYDFDSQISAADSNRLVADSAKVGTFATTGTSSNTRGSPWGSGSGSIDLEFTVSFGSEDAARYFFNSGGQVRIDMSHPAGTAQDNDWRASLITRVGQVRFDYTSTSSTGTSGLSSSLGYYDLTGSYQTIINGTNIGTGVYTTNDVFVAARRVSFGGVNGGNGTGVQFQIVLQDQHVGGPAPVDSVSAGTSASFSVLKATFLSGIVTPSGTVNNAF